VAAALHVVGLLEARLQSDPDDPSVDGLLLHLAEAVDEIVGFAPVAGSHLVFSHLGRPPTWSFEFWFGQKADSAREHAIDAVEARRSSLQTGDDGLESLARALRSCRAYLEVIEEQLLDDGLVIEEPPGSET
jgi:hypothetical protein